MHAAFLLTCTQRIHIIHNPRARFKNTNTLPQLALSADNYYFFVCFNNLPLALKKLDIIK